MKFVPRLLSSAADALPVKRTDRYQIFEHPFGRHLGVLKRLDAETIEAVRHENACRLSIVPLKVKGPLDLNVLKLCPELKSLYLHVEEPVDWTPVQHLRELEDLTLIARGHRPRPLEFRLFRHLHTVRISWYPEWASVLSCSTLQGLTIENSEKVQEFDLRRLPLLAELWLAECRGLQRLLCSPDQSLESLCVNSCRSFESFEPFKVLHSLKYASFGGNSRFDVQSLGHCHGLKSLNLVGVGKLPSLQFLSDCISLERFTMLFSTKIEDGDLNVLLKLPKLKAVTFRRFQNYTHTLKEISESIASRDAVGP